MSVEKIQYSKMNLQLLKAMPVNVTQMEESHLVSMTTWRLPFVWSPAAAFISSFVLKLLQLLFVAGLVYIFSQLLHLNGYWSCLKMPPQISIRLPHQSQAFQERSKRSNCTSVHTNASYRSLLPCPSSIRHFEHNTVLWPLLQLSLSPQTLKPWVQGRSLSTTGSTGIWKT